MRRSLILIALSGTAFPAFAHETGMAVPDAWGENRVALLLLAVMTAIYLGGLAAMRYRRPRSWPVSRSKVAAFLAAVLVLAAALLSPIESRAQSAFSIHMLQHLMLILVAAPMLAYSDAHLVILRALPLETRRTVGRTVASLPAVRWWAKGRAVAWITASVFVATLWFWHIPAAFDWALEQETVHAFEHGTLLLAACLFWRVVITSGDRRLSPAVTVILVSLVGIQGSFLAALIMFAPHRLYAAYAANPLDDQVLAGVLMCIPASFVYIGSTVWALSRMFANSRSEIH